MTKFSFLSTLAPLTPTNASVFTKKSLLMRSNLLKNERTHQNCVSKSKTFTLCAHVAHPKEHTTRAVSLSRPVLSFEWRRTYWYRPRQDDSGNGAKPYKRPPMNFWLTTLYYQPATGDSTVRTAHVFLPSSPPRIIFHGQYFTL